MLRSLHRYIPSRLGASGKPEAVQNLYTLLLVQRAHYMILENIAPIGDTSTVALFAVTA